MGFLSALKTYFDNSSLHGFPHITDTNRPIAERVFWAIVCSLAGYATWMLLQAAYYSYEHNAISFTLESDYLRWNTSFPAFSVCEWTSREKISLAAEILYGPDRNLNIEMFIRDIAFFDGSCRTCKDQCLNTLNCSGDLEHITRTTRKSCPELVKDCFWNGEPFECCSHFLPLETEIGQCFTINSANTIYPKGSKKLKMSVNRTSGPGSLTFSTPDNLHLYIHSPEEVPTISHTKEEKAYIYEGVEFHWVFLIREIVNDPLLEFLPLEQRNCRTTSENVPTFYKVYSYSGCMVDCRAQAQLKLCNCTHHLMPKIANVKTCNLDGLRCITDKQEQLKTTKCKCIMSCNEPTYFTISKRAVKDLLDSKNGNKTEKKIVLKMSDLPCLRFRRIVVRTMLDLFVSMGSTIGLFLGASLLSSVEIPYFLFIRRRNDIQEQISRKVQDIKTKKRPRKALPHDIWTPRLRPIHTLRKNVKIP